MRRMKKEEVKSGKEKRRKKRTKRGKPKRRRDGLVFVEAFDQGRDLESCGGLSWGDPLEKLENWSNCEPDSSAHVRVVPDVTDVLVSPSSVVTELCDVSSCCSDWEFVEPQSFSFSKKASTLLMIPLALVQNSNDTVEEEQGLFGAEDRMWSAKERTIIARTKQVL